MTDCAGTERVRVRCLVETTCCVIEHRDRRATEASEQGVRAERHDTGGGALQRVIQARPSFHTSHTSRISLPSRPISR
jgi:hypothetical protein